jgi:hypothetical protein
MTYKMKFKFFTLAIIASFFIFLEQSNAADDRVVKEYFIQIKDHKFNPQDIEVPANQKFKLIVENLDQTIEEFESSDLNKEKIISSNKKITLIISPLKPGTYKFFGDFHQKTAQGKIIAK